MHGHPEPIPPSDGILIENNFVRGRNVLVAEGDFKGLYADHARHLDAFSIEADPDHRDLFRKFLAGFTLHAASHPRNEVIAWTIHFQDPALNIFLTADTELSTVCGRVFTEGLREEPSNMFYQELVVRGKPLHRSIVPFEGTSAKGTIEFYYSQSEQRPGKFVQMNGERFALVSAHPDYDAHWFRNLADTEVAGLGNTETVSRIETRRYRWCCGCHYNKILEILGGPMEADPEGLFGDEETITVNCPRCAARYRVSREAMEAKVAERQSGHA
jgi:molecular chaperone Hsp33